MSKKLSKKLRKSKFIVISYDSNEELPLVDYVVARNEDEAQRKVVKLRGDYSSIVFFSEINDLARCVRRIQRLRSNMVDKLWKFTVNSHK